MSELQPIRILYMEDDAGLARLVQKRLRRAGYSVEVALDGASGLEMYDNGQYDLLAIDQEMPVHDGLTVIRKLLERGPLPPTIVVTGGGSESVAVEAMKLGASDYIVKDVAGGYLNLLPSVIDRCMEQQRLIDERAQALAALRASEERYRTIAAFMYDWEYWLDPDGEYVYISAACERITGYSAAEFTADRSLLESIVHPEDRAYYEQHWKQVWHTKNDGYSEFRIITREGSIRWIEHVCRPVYGADGRMLGRSIGNRDITERKEAETSLHKYTETLTHINQLGQKLASTLEADQIAAQLPTFATDIVDADGVSVWLLDGTSENALVCWAAHHHAQLENEPTLVNMRLSANKGVAGYVSRTGRSIIVDNVDDSPHYSPEVDEATGFTTHSILAVPLKVRGSIIGVLEMVNKHNGRFTSTDLTLAETLAASVAVAIDNARLIEQMRKLARAVEQSPSMVVITDIEGNIEYVNPEFTAITGYSYSEARGKKPSILKSDYQGAEFFNNLWATIRSGRAWRGEFQNYKKDGQLYWELASISPVRSKADAVTHFVKVGTDITERKRMEEALQQQTLELRSRNADLDAFAHTVAHDLKNPLTALIAAGGLLKRLFTDSANENVQQMLDMIVQQGYKMSSIIDELLLLASVRDAQDITLAPLNMPAIISEVKKRLQHLIQEYHPDILIPETWPLVYGHAPWVEEIWTNYISNAIKYGGNPEENLLPVVELGFDQQITSEDNPSLDPLVRFWIKDNGLGLSEEQCSGLFSQFKRLDKSRAEGHGLGLSIVQRIVNKLGGDVGVESCIGNGSVFWFTLPTHLK
ncbi:MAG: PAS domain S-box protein [Anaerolineae bacterium]|nr:PAS domain S-box protein [Anaerolineae bacterium]